MSVSEVIDVNSNKGGLRNTRERKEEKDMTYRKPHERSDYKGK